MLAHALQQLSQIFPPAPAFTEKHLPDLNGRVYLITGANTGVGKELAQILYSKNARVWIAARSQEKAAKAIDAIKEAVPASTGELLFLHIDLADVKSIASTAQEFAVRESKLHVLFNNAGVLTPPKGSTTAQGYEVQFGVNNIGTFMFTKLLTPILVDTVKSEAPGTVRVVWVSSSGAEAPILVPTGGVDIEDLPNRANKHPFQCYCLSKAGNYLHAVEMAKRLKEKGVISLAINPGNLKSDLWRTQGILVSWFLNTFILHPTIYGAYTELFAGLSPEVTISKSGSWIGPWGRFLLVRNDLLLAAKSREDGGYGTAYEFWEWTEAEIEKYL